MEMLAKVALGAGAISMVIGVLLRLMVTETVLGLQPSSFLEFSIACFLLTMALKAVSK